MPQVNTLLESVMQGLHSESIWTGRMCGASGLLGLRFCITTIGISTPYCNKPKNYPSKRCMSATTIILTLCSKSMHCWNPLCKGFILTHFGRSCCVGQHCLLIHAIICKTLVKNCKKHTKSIPRQERVKFFVNCETKLVSSGK